ncbi:hypothetical protein NP493_331g06004 [Ridgeia piscesae]|uniref:Uncharacterized protein n=1 Tax=Ridgeia piscesae TaxID=27915 RepID=A0AAD9L4H3_RIDPI|nr:hypothetical protein NP493_331g06004 [Ridgeia piscesae]
MTTRDMTTRDMTTRDMTTRDMTTRDMTTRDMTTRDMTTRDMTTRDMTTRCHLLYLFGPSSRQNARVRMASSSKNSVVNASHHRLSLSCQHTASQCHHRHTGLQCHHRHPGSVSPPTLRISVPTDILDPEVWLPHERCLAPVKLRQGRWVKRIDIHVDDAVATMAPLLSGCDNASDHSPRNSFLALMVLLSLSRPDLTYWCNAVRPPAKGCHRKLITDSHTAAASTMCTEKHLSNAGIRDEQDRAGVQQ